MKFTERMADYEARKRNRAQATTDQGLQERREARARLRAENLAKLSEEDRLLASMTRLPDNPDERRQLAFSLFEGPGGRKRKRREVAAIMGVAESTIAMYKDDPDGAKAKAMAEKKRSEYPRKGRVRSAYRPILAPPETPLGDRIHRRRRSRKLSQIKLAEELGVDVGLVRAWERNEVKPTPAQYALIAQALDL